MLVMDHSFVTNFAIDHSVRVTTVPEEVYVANSKCLAMSKRLDAWSSATDAGRSHVKQWLMPDDDPDSLLPLEWCRQFRDSRTTFFFQLIKRVCERL